MADDDLENDWEAIRGVEAVPAEPEVAPIRVSEVVAAIASRPPEMAMTQRTGGDLLARPSPPQFVTANPVPPVPTPFSPILTMSKMFDLLWFLVLSACSAGSIWVTYNLIVASGKILDCYVTKEDASTTKYVLMGRVDWREDTKIGYFQYMDDALAAKKKVCP